MLDPRVVSNAPPISRFSGVVALLLAGSFGLVAMWVLPHLPEETPASPSIVMEDPALPHSKMPPTPDPEQGVLVRYAAPPVPKPLAEELTKFCSAHVTESRSFVMFSRGSCVLVNEPSEDPIADAVKLLDSCAESTARFVPERTRDGGLIIGFREPVFHRFSDHELDELAPWLNQVAPTLMTPEETMSAGDNWNPPYHARVGLLARRRMLEDASTPVAVRVIRAKQRNTAAK